MRGPSAPTTLKPPSTGSWDTCASPGTKRVTASQTCNEKTEAKQYRITYTHEPQIERDGFQNGGLWRRPRGRLTGAPNIMVLGWRAQLEARDPSQWQASTNWQQGSIDWRAGMHHLEHTSSGSDTGRTTTASGAEAGHYPGGSISCATEADRKTSTRRWRRMGGWLQDGKRADADMCRFLSCFACRNVTKWRWTSWPPLTSGSSHQSKQRSNGVLIRGSLCFFDLFCSGSIFCFPLVKPGNGQQVGAPPSNRLARRLRCGL